MEPTLPMPHGSPEMGPLPPRAPEVGPAQSRELQPVPERPSERETQPHEPAAGAPPPMPVVPLPATSSLANDSSSTQSTAVDDGNPAAAADDDLIEKEWVEKAKRVISETKHDPYAQEKAISRLQADYLQKRYGKVIKLQREE